MRRAPREIFEWSSLIVMTSLVFLALLSGCVIKEQPSAVARSPNATPAPVSFSVAPSLSAIVDRVLPGVVYILAEAPASAKGGVASGSGVILRPDGYILTNRHVVDGAKHVQVTLQNRRVLEASGVWTDDITDLAVIKVEASDLPAQQFADSGSVRVGDWVLALGHALGLSPREGGASVTFGIVSNLGRSFTMEDINFYDVIQTDAAINQGNSGGPLVNMEGRVVGISAALIAQAQSIGYAINGDTARHIYEDLVKYGKPHHPFLGVHLGDVNPIVAAKVSCRSFGAVISKVETGSPAAQLGLQGSDVILSIDKEEIDSAATLIRSLWRHDVGDSVTMLVWRDGKDMTVTITLADRPKTDAV